MKIKNKIICMIMIIITLINISGISKATVIDETSMIVAGWRGDVQYSYNGVDPITITRSCDNIPTYTLTKSEAAGYFYPTAIEVYDNQKVKNVIKNGYGGKTLEELNCDNSQVAFLATQEAIYIELENRNIDEYVISGSLGDTVLNLTKQILEEVEKQKDVVDIILEDGYWIEYEKDTDYKYKEIQIEAENIENIQIEIKEGDARIVDEAGNEKTDFLHGDKFYLLVPKNVEQDVTLKASGEKNGMVIYACTKAEEPDNRYLIPTEGTETIEHEIKFNTLGNSKIEILNRDKETQEAINGNVYSIIKEDGTIVKENLVTDENGKINTVLDTGKYYLKQQSVVGEYALNKALIEINIEDVEPVKITIESAKSSTEESTKVNKEINMVEENKDIVENNITKVSNIKTTNINKEIINETNETNLHNVNNFINTINRKNVTNLTKENTYTNQIQEEFVNNKTIDGENKNSTMTRTDYINYIDMIMLDSAKVPNLPVASK